MADETKENNISEVDENPNKTKTSPEQYKKDKKYISSAEENAKYTITPEEKMGDTEEEFKQNTRPRSKYRKRKKMLPVIAIFGAMILVGGLILGSVVKRLASNNVQVDNYEPTVSSSSGAKPTPDDGLQIPTPEPEEGEINEPAVVVMSEDKASGEKYVFHRQDVSWTQAKELADAAGGHLVTVSSQEELEEVITLAMINDCNYVWLGCHRENGELIWENGEQISYYKWGKGEPSQYDSGDKVSEDYVLLWKFNGEWVYNDSRNDPVADYPDMYSGKIGFIVEFD